MCEEDDHSPRGFGLTATGCASSGDSTTALDEQTPSVITVTETTVVKLPATTEEQPSPTTKQSSGYQRSPDNKVIPVEALETVEVPSLCGNEATRLVNGKHPHPPRFTDTIHGRAELLRNDDGTPMGGFTDINGDGKDEAVLAYACDHGGVSWPDNLLFYDNDLNLTHWEEFFGDPEYPPMGANIRHMTWDEDSVQVTVWGWEKEGSGSCCPTHESVLDVTVGEPITFPTRTKQLSTRALR